jgi:hypothetical protein
VGQPGIGYVPDQRQPGRARGCFGGEIAVLFGAAERGEAAEQIEFERVDADIGRIAGAAPRRTEPLPKLLLPLPLSV